MMPRVLLITTLFALTAGLTHAQGWKSFLLKGNKYYDKENFTEAEINYKKALEENEEAVEGVFNLGDALYNQERYEEAIKQFELASKFMPSSRQKAQAWHNIGNAYLAQQDLQKSKDAYIEALKLNPNDPNTKYNLAYVNELMRQQQQQQQQQNQKQDQQENDEQKEDEVQNEGQQNEEDQNEGANQNEGDQNEEEGEGGQGELSKEEAEQLMDALRREEDKNQEALEKKMRQIPASADNEKDW